MCNSHRTVPGVTHFLSFAFTYSVSVSEVFVLNDRVVRFLSLGLDLGMGLGLGLGLGLVLALGLGRGPNPGQVEVFVLGDGRS